MSLNALIAQGPRPIQIEDPVNQLAKVMQIQAGQRQAQLGEMQMEEYGEKRERARGLRDLLKQNYDTPDARESALMRGGYVEEATKLGTDRRANLKADTENSAATFKLANDRYSTFQKTMGALKDDPNLSKQLLMQVGQNLVQQGIIPASMYQGAVADMPDDPALLRQRLTQGLATQLPPEKVFELFAPKAEKIDNGASISFRDTNPNSPTYGQQTGGAPVQKQQSPDNAATVNASMANANATREVAAATRDAAKIGKQYETEQGLRKEFEALPEVKKYKSAVPAFKGIEDAVKRNTPQSDINIVYGIAKLYDPESVVREGEYATVANSPNIPERVKGYAQYLAGGGRLTQKVKDEILAEARSRMQSFDTEFTKARGDFESIATRTGVDPTRVFPSAAKPVVGGGAAGRGVIDFGSLK